MNKQTKTIIALAATGIVGYMLYVIIKIKNEYNKPNNQGPIVYKDAPELGYA